MPELPRDGDVADRFAGAADTLLASIGEGEDVGAHLCVFHKGRKVIDLTAGYADRKRETPLDPETLLPIYSCGKLVMAALVMRAVGQDRLDYDAPVADVWASFGARGKERVTLAEALSHQAGVPGFVKQIDPALWLDWDGICAAIADLSPLWPPGSAFGYHPQTIGFIAGEVLRRATGKSFGEHLVALGVDVHCGLGPRSASRAGEMFKPPRAPGFGEVSDATRAAFMEPWSSPTSVEPEEWLAAEIPASNCHATARGLAEIAEAFTGGEVRGEVFAYEGLRDRAIEERASGTDRVLGSELAWAAGPMRNRRGLLGPNPAAIGHYGFGGSFVLSDPEHYLSVAYVPNRMVPNIVGGPRALALIDAIYAGL